MGLAKVLLVDDDPQSLDSTRRILEHAGYAVELARDGFEGLEKLRLGSQVDLVLTDVRMPRVNGIDFLRVLAHDQAGLPVILMTAFGQVEDAVQAMKLGAVDFLSKPFKRQSLLSALETALRRAKGRHASLENPRVRPEPRPLSLVMQGLEKQIQQVAGTRATVLILGESGSGKERVARSVHEQSPRAQRRWVALNCGAVPESLVESELFGHERGAFTGAVASKVGLLEAADQGTLFLDEIGDLPLSAQVKLLRAIQEGEIRRVGSNVPRKVDVRLIAATHRNLHEEVKAGRFREDLLYRLEVVSLRVPALRERLEDLPQLIQTLLHDFNEIHGKQCAGLSSEALSALFQHPWPGNIRELANALERSVVFANQDEIGLGDLPPHLARLVRAAESDSSREKGTLSVGPSDSPSNTITVKIGTPLREVEDLMIRRTLEAMDGDKGVAARLLGINSRTIYRRLESNREEADSDDPGLSPG